MKTEVRLRKTNNKRSTRLTRADSAVKSNLGENITFVGALCMYALFFVCVSFLFQIKAYTARYMHALKYKYESNEMYRKNAHISQSHLKHKMKQESRNLVRDDDDDDDHDVDDSQI